MVGIWKLSSVDLLNPFRVFGRSLYQHFLNREKLSFFFGYKIIGYPSNFWVSRQAFYLFSLDGPWNHSWLPLLALQYKQTGAKYLSVKRSIVEVESCISAPRWGTSDLQVWRPVPLKSIWTLFFFGKPFPAELQIYFWIMRTETPGAFNTRPLDREVVECSCGHNNKPLSWRHCAVQSP